MTKREILDRVGEAVIRFVRDDSIRDYEQLETGEQKPPQDRAFHDRLCALPHHDANVVRDLAVRMVDQTLHDFLWMLEGGEQLELFLKLPSGERINVTELSDGLAGELYGPEGWIARFSRYPSAEEH
jgi:hypothetical protein